MDAETWALIVKAFGELTLTGFLFANWWMERTERIKNQADHKAHLESDITRLLEQTEELQKAK
jgi:hypothetical protein